MPDCYSLELFPLTEVISKLALQGFTTHWVRQIPLRVIGRSKKPCQMRNSTQCLFNNTTNLNFVNIFSGTREALLKRERLLPKIKENDQLGKRKSLSIWDYGVCCWPTSSTPKKNSQPHEMQCGYFNVG